MQETTDECISSWQGKRTESQMPIFSFFAKVGPGPAEDFSSGRDTEAETAVQHCSLMNSPEYP